jgi:hypothetical protein
MDRWTDVKVAPSNQTLILASERGLKTNASSRAPSGAGSDGTLKRVTVFAARPDDTLLYVQAEYASPADYVVQGDPPTSAETVDPESTVQTSLPAQSSQPVSASGGFNRTNRGVELYASTQRLPAESAVTQIDAYA